MKKELFALLLLFLLLAGAIINVWYLSDFTEGLLASVDAANEAARIGAWQAARTHMETAARRWLHADKYANVFIRHAEIDNATDAFCLALGEIEKRDPGGFQGACCVLRSHLSGIYDMERLSFGTVF